MKNLNEILKSVGSTAEFLFTEITDVNQKSNFGDTPLHVVSRWGDAEAAEVLIKAGADVNARGDAGQTPLFSAVMGRSLDIVRYLLNAGADPLIVDDDGEIAFDYTQNVPESKPISDELVTLLRITTTKARKQGLS